MSQQQSTIRGPTHKELEALLPKISKGWSNVEKEVPEGFFFSPELIEGTVPKQLRGTFIRNGPGLNNVFGTQLAHPIDGDGIVATLTFNEGQAHFRSRFVQTKTHVDEQKAKKMLYNGQMGSMAPAGETIKKGWRDPSHTNAFYVGNKIIAAHEYALPHSLNPSTLETLGQDTMNGALELRTMSAHYRVDADRDLFVTNSFKPGVPMLNRAPFISFYEWDRDLDLKKATRLSLKDVNYSHDFMLTPHWYGVHVTPFIDLSAETGKAIAEGKTSPGQSMRYIPGAASEFVFIERYPASSETRKIVRLQTEPTHIYHYAHCRENLETGIISFQACCLPMNFNMEWQHKAFLSNTGDAPGVMHSYDVNPALGQITRRCTPGLENTSCEFPTTHPYRHCVRSKDVSTRFIYIMGGAPSVALPFTDVIKYDLQTQMVSRWHSEGVVGEPCFMPRLGRASAWHGEEDDGWVIVQVYLHEQHKVQYCILDAKKIHEGPICRLNLPFHMPFGFHGSYTDEVFVRPAPKL